MYGNDLSAIGAFFLASDGHIHIAVFFWMLIGLSLVMASACVFNNYIDRDIDHLMERTKSRELVVGSIPEKNVLRYGAALGIIGIIVLSFGANPLTAFVALVGWLSYVVLYTRSKRKTHHATLIGSISGAIPPVVGYTAVTNRLDIGALLLFAILVCWQMPHFFAIALRRKREYAAANIPIMPIVKGKRQTKIQICWYIIGFIIACNFLTVFSYTGIMFSIVMTLTGIWWLRLAMDGFSDDANVKWAGKLFGRSLVVLLILCVMLCINSLLP